MQVLPRQQAALHDQQMTDLAAAHRQQVVPLQMQMAAQAANHHTVAGADAGADCQLRAK